MSGPKTLLRAEEVSKSYSDVAALADVSMSLAPGEIRCLLGRNGAGKTTLVNILAGLLRPDRGTVALEGQTVRPWDRRLPFLIGLAPQELSVYPLLTVAQNLRTTAQLYGFRGAKLRASIVEMIDRLELGDFADRMASRLSGGEKRRLHTAMALIHAPRLALLDEPTAGADVRTRSNVLDLVRGLAADGTAVLYTSHYMNEVETLAGNVSILERGRIIAEGACNELIAAHGTSYLELQFDGDLPTQTLPAEVARDANSIRIEVNDVASALVEIPRTLPENSRKALVSIEAIRPSLETVFVSLTGRRYEDAG